MRRRICKTLFYLLILAAIYAAIMSIKRVDAGTIGVITDRSGNVVRMVAGDGKKMSFVWQAALRWRYRYSTLSVSRTAHTMARIKFPELDNLKEDYYLVRASMRIAFRINPGTFHDMYALGSSGSMLDTQVSLAARDELLRVLAPYMTPGYRRDELAAALETVADTVRRDLAARLKPSGILVTSLEFRGPVFLPEKKVHAEGLVHAAALRAVDKKNEMDRMDVMNRMLMEREKNKFMYAHLNEMSRLLKDNPDLLKYIYIDKLGHDVKVILSSDASGFPALLESTSREPRKIKKKEVDNLR